MTIKYDKATNGVTIYKKPKVKTVNGKRMKFYGSIDFGRPILPQPKEPKRKTSVYLDEENIETIKGFKEKYNLSLNRTINMCLTKYLPEMRVWI